MAGEPLSLTELKEWYAAFNAVINAYGGGTIDPLTDPADGSKVLPEHINNAYDKITAMKNDAYLGTQDFYSTFTKVATGEEVVRPDSVPITDTMAQIKGIKCRNTTTFTNGYHTNTQKSHSTHSNGAKSNSKNGNGSDSNGNWGNENNANGTYSGCSTNWCNNGLCYWGAKGNGDWSNGALSHGALSHGVKSNGDNTHSAKSHSSQVDILNVHTTLNKN